jgi:hypothetical protein
MPDGLLDAELDLGSHLRECYVTPADDSDTSDENFYSSPRASSRHHFAVRVGRAYRLRLR